MFFDSRNVVRGAYGSICALEGFPSQSFFVPHEAPTSGNFLMNCGKATALHSILVISYFGRSAWDRNQLLLCRLLSFQRGMKSE